MRTPSGGKGLPKVSCRRTSRFRHFWSPSSSVCCASLHCRHVGSVAGCTKWTYAFNRPQGCSYFAATPATFSWKEPMNREDMHPQCRCPRLSRANDCCSCHHCRWWWKSRLLGLCHPLETRSYNNLGSFSIGAAQ